MPVAIGTESPEVSKSMLMASRRFILNLTVLSGPSGGTNRQAIVDVALVSQALAFAAFWRQDSGSQ